MRYRQLGKTGLMVSEIGYGPEWLEGKTREEGKAIADRCMQYGINICDCWMSDPEVRSNLGDSIRGFRDRWFIQGHFGATWQNGQYLRTRDLKHVIPAFEDELRRLHTDYFDIGMIHYVDEQAEWDRIQDSPFLQYVMKQKENGTVRHIGLSTHNPLIAKQAVQSGIVEMLMFSVNPVFDMLPPSEDLEDYRAEEFDAGLGGIYRDRAELYALCEREGVGITVMKGLASGRLFDAKRSPFGVALTPVQCLHYALTRPAVASVLVGYSEPAHVDAAVAYETATDEEKDYASVLAGASRHAYRDMCTYCNHCKPCPSGIDIAMVNKLYDLAVTQEKVPSSVLEHYRNLSAHASDCVECGGCRKRCPFDVDVISYMRKAKELFGI